MNPKTKLYGSDSQNNSSQADTLVSDNTNPLAEVEADSFNHHSTDDQSAPPTPRINKKPNTLKPKPDVQTTDSMVKKGFDQHSLENQPQELHEQTEIESPESSSQIIVLGSENDHYETEPMVKLIDFETAQNTKQDLTDERIQKMLDSLDMLRFLETSKATEEDLKLINSPEAIARLHGQTVQFILDNLQFSVNTDLANDKAIDSFNDGLANYTSTLSGSISTVEQQIIDCCNKEIHGLS